MGERQAWPERIAVGALWAAAGSVTALFLWLVGQVIWRGAARLSWKFLVSAPMDSGRAGGIGPILVSTSLILLVCLVASGPLSIAAAMWLSEFTAARTRAARWVRASLDVLAGVPSIVFGLFGNAFFCKTLGMGFSIASGGLTLACMVLPLWIRAAEEGFRSVPADIRLEAAALGMTRSQALLRVHLPLALPGLAVGMALGVGRALAETAALIFTSGYVTRMPESLLDSGRALSVNIFDLSMNIPGGDEAAYATAVVLVALLMVVHTVTLWTTRRWSREWKTAR